MLKKDNIINFDPFKTGQVKKSKIFLSNIKEVAIWHYRNCPQFKTFCDTEKFDIHSNYSIENFPYLPVSMFKNKNMISVATADIKKILYSAATTGNPSKIFVDRITSERQEKTLSKIAKNFFGHKRKIFIIFDTPDVIKEGQTMSCRGATFLGLISLVKKMFFVLDKNLKLDIKKLEIALSSANADDEIYIFGYTWLMYLIYQKNKNNKKLLKTFKKNKNNKILIHAGGWKKYEESAVSKKKLNKLFSDFFQIKKEKIVDMYGMVEHLGIIYPDCEYGYKHLPIYSEISCTTFFPASYKTQPIPAGPGLLRAPPSV